MNRSTATVEREPLWQTWIVRGVVALALLVVVSATATGWGAIVHGYPLYGPLLIATVVVSVVVGWRTLRSRPARTGWRRLARVVLIVAALVWIALIAWLRPFSAVEPALTAMESDAVVTVSESPTRVVFQPSGNASGIGVFFQPGAKVEARAYAAVLRPLAAAGHTVIIAKQPLGIAFLALPAFDSAKDNYLDIHRWVIGGHSLGGTVAAAEADTWDSDSTPPVVGLLLYASYPANDISTTLNAEVLSLSGSEDGLATPAEIDASKSRLPTSAEFKVITGAVHSFFADYGPQPGDGTPTISHDDARTRISSHSVGFIAKLDS